MSKSLLFNQNSFAGRSSFFCYYNYFGQICTRKYLFKNQGLTNTYSPYVFANLFGCIENGYAVRVKLGKNMLEDNMFSLALKILTNRCSDLKNSYLTEII